MWKIHSVKRLIISLKAVIANVPCYYQLERLRENRIDCREGTSQIVECVGVETPHCGNVVDPHCQDVEMWWIHIFSVVVHINFKFILELT